MRIKERIKTELKRWRFFRDFFEKRRQQYQRKLDLEALRRRQLDGRWWLRRIHDALACPDNECIPRHPQAGQIIDECQIMHNGVRIARGSYDGLPVQKMLCLNRGVHEPQEERIFGEALKYMPAGGVMMELGAYWGFYSLWFAKTVPNARCFLVEPFMLNLNSGRLNFLLNNLTATFFHGGIGAKNHHNPFAAPTVTVDYLMQMWGLDHVHLLHSDIQGFEADMLRGAEQALHGQKIDFIFISTHSSEIHRQCAEELRRLGFCLMVDMNLDESYSVDGVLAARRAELAGPPENFPVSRKPRMLTPGR